MKDKSGNMKCGNCGEDSFRVFSKKSESGLDGYDSFVIECIKCSSTSELEMFSMIKIGWGKNSEGILYS